MHHLSDVVFEEIHTVIIPGQKKPSTHSTGLTISGTTTPGDGGEVELPAPVEVEFTLTIGVGVGVGLGLEAGFEAGLDVAGSGGWVEGQ